ncbi:MAG: hypothetical protein ABIV21_02535 [Pyrinomonadaceae bacterium]
MITKNFCERFLKLLVFLGEKIFCSSNTALQGRFIFNRVQVGELIIEGDITKMKIEIGQNIHLTAVSDLPYEVGTAVATVQASDADGNDVSGEFKVEASADNELDITITRDGTTECTGVITLRADGDPDADEEAPMVGTADFVYDSKNASVFDLTIEAVDPA